MRPRRIRPARELRKASPLLCLLVPALLLLFPLGASGADIDVSFEELSVLDGTGRGKTDFLPGEEAQVRVRFRVLQWTGNPFFFRLRISGAGWREAPITEALVRTGLHTFTYSGLRTASTAAPGKVSLVADVLSAQDTVSLRGRRHAYLNIRCPEGLPAGRTARLRVGAPPRDMALTGDGLYLYVTSEEERKVTVIDVEAGEVLLEIDDPELLGTPTGVAAYPNRQEMYIADSALQAIHVVDAQSHVLEDLIQLNPTGEFGVTSPGDVAVNPVRNEAYVTDSRGPRIFVLDLTTRESRLVSLVGPSAGLSPMQVVRDPDNPRFIYVLCGGLSEVIKVDVVSGSVLDFVRLRDIQDLSSLWPAWSMTLNPWTGEVYVVVNPGGFETTYPTIESKIFILPDKNRLNGPGRGELLLGSSIWELAVREDGTGRFVYAIDSYRGEILVIDMSTGTEMSRCAIPVEPGGRFLRADSAENRLFVGGWLAGFADIVE